QQATNEVHRLFAPACGLLLDQRFLLLSELNRDSHLSSCPTRLGYALAGAALRETPERPPGLPGRQARVPAHTGLPPSVPACRPGGFERSPPPSSRRAAPGPPPSPPPLHFRRSIIARPDR